HAVRAPFRLLVSGADGSLPSSPTRRSSDLAAADFSISASPGSLSLAQGMSGSSSISTAITSGSAGTVTLSVSGVPSGATASLSPTSVTAGGGSVLTVLAGTAAAGTYVLVVTGIEGSNTHSVNASLQAPAAADFSLSAPPATPTLT